MRTEEAVFVSDDVVKRDIRLEKRVEQGRVDFEIDFARRGAGVFFVLGANQSC